MRLVGMDGRKKEKGREIEIEKEEEMKVLGCVYACMKKFSREGGEVSGVYGMIEIKKEIQRDAYRISYLPFC